MTPSTRPYIWTDAKRLAGCFLAFALMPMANATMLKPAFCALTLTAGSRVEHTSPLGSLIDIQRKLTKMAKGKKMASDGYAAQDYRGDLRKPRRLFPLHRIDFNSVRARLRDLESDTTAGDERLMFAGYEFRGEKQVRAALDVFKSEGPALNARILEGLRERYPKVRLHTFASLALTSGLIGLPAHALWDPNPRIATIGALMLPFTVAMAAVNEFGLPLLARAGQYVPDKHFSLIESALGNLEGAPISIVSNQVDVKVEFHKLLMNVDLKKLNAQELALFVDSAEAYMTVYLDDKWEAREFAEASKNMSALQIAGSLQDLAAQDARDFPEGRYRHLYYDSIFYVENGQPVWLVYYRSFKQRPISGRRPTQPRTQAQPQWDPSWLPGAARVSP